MEHSYGIQCTLFTRIYRTVEKKKKQTMISEFPSSHFCINLKEMFLFIIKALNYEWKAHRIRIPSHLYSSNNVLLFGALCIKPYLCKFIWQYRTIKHAGKNENIRRQKLVADKSLFLSCCHIYYVERPSPSLVIDFTTRGLCSENLRHIYQVDCCLMLLFGELPENLNAIYRSYTQS